MGIDVDAKATKGDIDVDIEGKAKMKEVEIEKPKQSNEIGDKDAKVIGESLKLNSTLTQSILERMKLVMKGKKRLIHF